MATQWTKAPNVVWEEMDGRALLIDAKSGARCTLDAAATAVWKLCDGTRGASDLADALFPAMGQARSAIGREIAEFCRQIAGLGMPQAAGNSHTAIPLAQANFHSGPCARLSFESLGLTGGPRRRPSPRGNSGPG